MDPDDYVRYASYRLQGATAAWWGTYQEMQASRTVITWVDFLKNFWDYHIPEGLMEKRREEFLSLIQGHKTVEEYNREFI